MFEVIAELSPEHVHQSIETGVPLWGQVFLSWDGRDFPGSAWTDFVDLVLDEWLTNLRAFETGLVDEMANHFMDEGKYWFTVTRRPSDHVVVTCRESSSERALQFEIAHAEYVRALLKACRKVIARYEAEAGPGSMSTLRQALAFFSP
jgi:hypothetical protein